MTAAPGTPGTPGAPGAHANRNAGAGPNATTERRR